MFDRYTYIEQGSSAVCCSCNTYSLVLGSSGVCLGSEVQLSLSKLNFTITTAGKVVWDYIETAGRELLLTVTAPLKAVRRAAAAVSYNISKAAAKISVFRKLPVRHCCFRL